MHNKHNVYLATYHPSSYHRSLAVESTYLNVGRGFCQLDDTFHAIQKAQARVLSQDHRQDGMHVVCEQVMPHTLTCTRVQHQVTLC